MTNEGEILNGDDSESKEIIINNVLCYISSSLNNKSSESIV